MKTEKYNSYVSAEDRANKMSDAELRRELIATEQELSLGRSVMKQLRQTEPKDHAALSAAGAVNRSYRRYVKVLVEERKERKPTESSPYRVWG